MEDSALHQLGLYYFQVAGVGIKLQCTQLVSDQFEWEQNAIFSI